MRRCPAARYRHARLAQKPGKLAGTGRRRSAMPAASVAASSSHHPSTALGNARQLSSVSSGCHSSDTTLIVTVRAT